MAIFSSYRAAAAALPTDAKWSCSFGYPGEGGFAEYFRDARGERYIIQNGEFGDKWTMRPESPYGSNLPIFPCFYDRPSEDRFERVVSRLVDHADSALLSGKATQQQYDLWNRALSRWADSVKLEA